MREMMLNKQGGCSLETRLDTSVVNLYMAYCHNMKQWQHALAAAIVY